ncbi:MAG: hypothetical protein A2096_01165 [Spirochaetes bacterium GWF1_41_5]|nr:MAG: hypothetical protein A2096_01165 [Spirochaetes bacterium GWF1_41_5]
MINKTPGNNTDKHNYLSFIVYFIHFYASAMKTFTIFNNNIILIFYYLILGCFSILYYFAVNTQISKFFFVVKSKG